MEGKRLIRRLALQNFLSYGSEGAEIELQPLNVLIGPNASGKSNLIEALAILRATARDLAQAVRSGGGIEEFVWKRGGPDAVASVEAAVEIPNSLSQLDEPLLYRIGMQRAGARLHVVEESITQESSIGSQVFFELGGGEASIFQRPTPGDILYEELLEREIRRKDLTADQSILTQRKDPDLYPELTYLADRFAEISVFQEWTLGRRNPARLPAPTDLPSDFLLPDASNLALVLQNLMQQSRIRNTLLEHLRQIYASAQHISTRIQGAALEIFIEEESGVQVSSARLSDGTLRYLALLTILCHPTPPPLVCIEEPELGLHPDVIPTIAELLRDASQRTQLVVTTHSDTLVSALSDIPESIVVCEPGPKGTTLQRLDRESLAGWLEKYSLGEVWRMGGIGGTRW